MNVKELRSKEKLSELVGEILGIVGTLDPIDKATVNQEIKKLSAEITAIKQGTYQGLDV